MSAPASAAEGFRRRIERGGSVQVVAFHLGGELHGCDIALVEEVVTRQRIHPLPDVPPEMLGVILLRGEMLPVLDLGPALGVPASREDRRAVLVVGLGGSRAGVAVDRMEEVLDVPADSVRPAPHTGGDRDPFVAGVARLDAGLVNLIDLAELLRERTTPERREPA